LSPSPSKRSARQRKILSSRQPPRAWNGRRCRTCDSIVMVVFDRRGMACVDLRGLARLEHP
jgi:hypothetical protein